MPQFAVYRNKNSATKGRFPFLVDVQSDLLEPLATRVVVPLAPLGSAKPRLLETLTPVLHVEGKDYLALIPQLAGVAARDVGPVVGSAAEHRQAILAALDLLVYGV